MAYIPLNDRGVVHLKPSFVMAVVQVLVWKEIEYGSMSDREKQMLVSEVNILREFRHPHIVRSAADSMQTRPRRVYPL